MEIQGKFNFKRNLVKEQRGLTLTNFKTHYRVIKIEHGCID